ncbi:MAG: hypothetical protein K6F26_03365 [Lachnospiraceae bacterium]|nr:hypothetical protein [Lachnospiraceae bacterium]
MRVKKNIKITLKSDLCASSGLAYAGTIDTDVCIDSCGFPYIPGRRLKGIMRSAADIFMDKDDCDSLFGRGGEASHNGIQVNNAVIPGTDSLTDEIAALQKNPNEQVMTQQNIIELFTSVRGQTSLTADGVADENTLRYTRVVNQYAPKCLDTKQEELTFLAPVEYEAEQEERLSNVLRAVRHLGMDRNRGLGNVRCELVPIADAATNMKESVTEKEDDKPVVLKVVYRNIDQMMLSSDKDDITDRYISGQVVLGALAGAYLRSKGIKDPDDAFNDMFLKGACSFGNLYPTDNPELQFVPVPMYLRRLKKSKKYVCVAGKYNPVDFAGQTGAVDYDTNNGNQPKKLTGKYVCYFNGKIRVIEPRTEIVYHHSKKETYDLGRAGENPEEGILYNMEVLEKGQLFSGIILVSGKYKNTLLELIRTNTFRFGKSKSAQYGRCVLEKDVEISDWTGEQEKELKAGRVFVVLESDAVIPGGYGYTVKYEEVLQHIASKTGLKAIPDASVYMEIKTVTGYNAKINLKRASVPAIVAGSAFEMEVPQDGKYKECFIGKYCSEGFGRIRIVEKSSMIYRQEEWQPEAVMIQESSVCFRMKNEIKRKQRLESLKAEFIKNKSNYSKVDLSSSLIGRITLMLKESQNSRNETGELVDSTIRLNEFAKRIASIKREKERNTIIRALKEQWKVCKVKMQRKEYSGVENLMGTDVQELWEEYLAFILLNLKYQKSSEIENVR